MQTLAVVATVAVGVIAIIVAAISLVKWIYGCGEVAGHAKAHHEAEIQAQAQFAAELSALKERLSELYQRQPGSSEPS